MAIATITTIYCVHEATGTDLSVIESITRLPEMLVPDSLGVSVLLDGIRALPEVIAVIDIARSDPDNLYVTTSTEGDIDNSVWPGSGETVDMLADQSVAPNIVIEFSNSQNISLWDYDTSSGDDLLGSVIIFETEQGRGEIAKMAKSTVESSYYYIFYKVE